MTTNYPLGVFILLSSVGIILLLGKINRDETPKKDYRYIPEEWIAYRQTSVFVCPITGQPTCFALRNNSTFVIGSSSPHAISFFNEQGTLLQKIGLPEEPQAVACGPDTIVIAHPKRIAVYNVEGECKRSCTLPDEKSDIRSLVVTPDYIFAADTGKRCIYRMNERGDLNLTFEFQAFSVYASSITMTFSSADSLLYVTNPGKHRVEVFTQDGEYLPQLSWGKPSGSLDGFAACCNPIDVAALDDGRILTVEKAVSRIKIFRAVGQLDCVVAGYNTLNAMPMEFDRTPLEPGGRYFSALPLSGGRIAVFDFAGLIRIFTPQVFDRYLTPDLESMIFEIFPKKLDNRPYI